eukprot:CAMPEP_0201564470 /NCGR_PEP_ID=MMETSP0190_2-20130828/2781_1 /ASSEMBLY_ACC=CAM_ASM_000263 /TAXON_ID=37353 /ORGANISM="Rosalina sp." /LENGTH=416 /DNA_ID=CAMNT_0047980691 /DNA_START=95 /DNA_END=1345 /DNA_ORIENTATION=+
MEALQPSRPPMSQQPPQRIDGINNNINSTAPTLVENKEADKSANNNQQSTNSVSPTNQTQQQQQRDTNIPDVDISIAYKRRSLKHRIECGFDVKIGKQEIEELAIILGQRKCQMYKTYNNDISTCIVCLEPCTTGKHAVETVLFIPNKNDPAYDNLGRFRIELPRIACHECSAEYASENNIKLRDDGGNNKGQGQSQSLGRIWQMYQNGELNQSQNNTTDQSKQQQQQQRQHQHQNQSSSSALSGVGMVSAVISPVAGGNNTCDDDNKIGLSEHQQQQPPPQQQQQQVPHQRPQEAERDPFDDGFLICTQLVKTGGADQGGLQVGDVFVEFGHYSKKRFPGLKSIANLVRRSAGKEINVVVWRKLEQMNGVEDDGTGRTVFQKLALKLKPLQSHDADGGGVLGAVINTYPLPEMKN